MRLIALVNRRNEAYHAEIEAVVDALLASDFLLTPSNHQLMMNTISCITEEVQPTDGFLATKCSQLITKLGKLCVLPPDRTVIDGIRWCIRVLRECTSINVLHILGALEVLFRANGNLIQTPEDLFAEDGLFRKYLGSEPVLFSTTPEVQLMVVKCMKSLLLTSTKKLSPTLTERIHELLIGLLSRIYDQCGDICHCQIVLKSLLCLERIFEVSTDVVRSNHLGDLLGIIKSYMFYGLPSFGSEAPRRLYSMTLSLACSQSSNVNVERGAKAIRLRKGKTSRPGQASDEDDNSKGLPAELPAAYQQQRTTESEVPGAEMEMNSLFKLKLEKSRVRAQALAFLGLIVKETDHKVMFGFWRWFLPDGPNPACHLNIVSSLRQDPFQCVRMEAINVLIYMLCGSRKYLCQAESSEKTSGSFRPFSLLLGDMVTELHSSLYSAVLTERSTTVVVHLLRCIAKLVQNTTYHRLAPGLLTKLIMIVSKFMSHKVWTVQVASLTALGSVISITPAVKEVEVSLMETLATIEKRVDQLELISGEENSLARFESVLRRNLQGTLDGKHITQEEDIPWVLEVCLLNLGLWVDPHAMEPTTISLIPPVTVRVESLQVLTCLAKNYFQLVVLKYLDYFVKAILIGVSDPDINVHLHAGKTIQAIGSAFTQLGAPHMDVGDLCDDARRRSTEEEEEEEEEDVDVAETTFGAAVSRDWILSTDEGGGRAIVQQGLSFWNKMLTGPVSSLLENRPETSLHATGCQCLASIDKNIFELLDPIQQQEIIGALVGRAEDKDLTVRAEAVHSLGIVIHFPSVRNDIHVFDFTEKVLINVENESMNVRASASWALSNLSEVLVLNEADRNQKIPHAFMRELLVGSIRLASSSEKLQVGSVRALGNLLMLIDTHMIMDSELRRLTIAAVKLLIHLTWTSRNMKTRWNACYSLGNMMKNTSLYDKSEIDWQCLVFPALMDVVKNSVHFKVRTGAATALRAPTERWKYGQYFMDVWRALVVGLETSQNLSDYTEYSHQEHLRDEICYTICHLTVLLSSNDVERIPRVLLGHLDNLPGYFKKFQENILPEKADLLLSATNHLRVMMESPELFVDDISGPGMLLRILVHSVV
ncbi:HEAT repeat-containing protein 6 [Anabrus simplex]|uniref:HEAT repeat-containing protein 6 n=1 Tax=Anabrus simplex TaxID=316456 RepID=UPI0035A38C26